MRDNPFFKAYVFVRHIARHLLAYERITYVPQDTLVPICKICDSTIDEIWERER